MALPAAGDFRERRWSPVVLRPFPRPAAGGLGRESSLPSSTRRPGEPLGRGRDGSTEAGAGRLGQVICGKSPGGTRAPQMTWGSGLSEPGNSRRVFRLPCFYCGKIHITQNLPS